MSIGQRIIEEICAQGMIRIAHPDPETAHVFVWSANAEEQLEALVCAHYLQRGLGRTITMAELGIFPPEDPPLPKP